MGTNENVTLSKTEKSSPTVQDQPSVYPYPDWASMQAYYGPGVPIPPPYFNATVASGHAPHPYMWSPQSMITAFPGPYTAIYPHGAYTHPSATHMASPVNQDVCTKYSASKERVAKKGKLLNGCAVSVGNGNSETAGCNGNGLSQSEDNDEDGSSDGSDGSDGTTESGGSKDGKNRSSENLPYSGNRSADRSANAIHGAENITPPIISSEMTAPSTNISGKAIVPVPSPNLTPGADLKVSSIRKVNSGGALLPTSSTMDERALKREKRKQSNRESARRSRLRKQAETEELSVKVGTLTAENTTIRSEINRLTESSEKLRLENSTLMDKLKMVQAKQAEDMVSRRMENEDSPTIVIENLLSRIDSSGPVEGSNQMEDEFHVNSSGKLHQLLDSKPRTDAVAAS